MAAVAEGGTMPPNSLRIFLSQEVRWGSNSGGIPPSHLPLSSFTRAAPRLPLRLFRHFSEGHREQKNRRSLQIPE